MSGAASAAFCCAGNCLCHAINNMIGDAKKINPKLFARIGFIILSVLSVGFSLLILFYLADILKPFNDWVSCPKDNQFDCLGISSVYRMSFTLLVFHVMTLLFSFTTNECAKVFNMDCWSFKILFITVFYFSMFFISNNFFTVYAEITRFLSIIFLIYQALVIISFGHIINVKLVEHLDNAVDKGENTCKYQFWLIFLSLIFGGLTIYWFVDSCINHFDSFTNILIIILSIMFGILFTVLSITNIVTRKRLLTSIFIFSYISYLCWSALNSQPKDGAKLVLSFWDILIGLFYLFLALGLLGFYIKKKPEANESEEQKEINKNPLIEEAPAETEDRELLSEKKPETEIDLSRSYILFHIFMMFMSIYYCMLMTNWTIIDTNSTGILTQTWTSFWVKIGVLGSTILLYVWILVAPIVFPDREFEF
jgi:hypothetical protein